MIRKSVKRFSEQIMLKQKLHLAGDERIGHPLLADARAGAVAADEADIVAKRQQLGLDRVDQGRVTAAGQIGATDRAREQDVADMGEAQILVEEHTTLPGEWPGQ
ncbi:hypothetical protein ACVWWO_004949 [Bradyrhizobium sp. F1.13.1]